MQHCLVTEFLVYYSKLNERMDAVEELVHTSSPKKSQVKTLLKQLPDIEKGLCRIHYGKVMLLRDT